MECLAPAVKFDIFIISYFTFVRLPTTLELTTFEQQLYSKTQLRYHWAAKKGTWRLWTAYIKQ